MQPIRSAAIIGAGMAGLSVARKLREAGISVSIFDKGRQAGGRLATRHAEGFSFNHGCQFATARDDGFRAMLLANGAALWPAAGPEKFSGAPAMARIARSLATPLGAALHGMAHVSFLRRAEDGWHLSLRDAGAVAPSLVEPGGDSAGPFDAICLAMPAPQAQGLLAAIGHGFAAALAGVSIAPCWALMLGFAGAVAGPDVLKPEQDTLSWLARENSRPGAPAAPTAYTIHASPGWSRANLEAPAQTVQAALQAAFTATTGITAQPVYARTHRWRYALADTPLGAPCLWDPEQNIGLCGDWCLGGRLEAAYLSSRALGIKLTA